MADAKTEKQKVKEITVNGKKRVPIQNWSKPV